MNKKICFFVSANLLSLVLPDRVAHSLTIKIPNRLESSHASVYPYRNTALCETNLLALEEDAKKDVIPQKHHTLSVCLVPPEAENEVWDTLTSARTELRDPGLFRWPPHVNLLYPFVSVRESYTQSIIDETFLSKLRNATQQVEPFHISLDRTGTFGDNSRGVLWLHPRSCRLTTDNYMSNNDPVCALQALLEREFPTCAEGLKHREFIPHLTVSHFSNLEEAEAAKTHLDWMPPPSFLCEEIYLLERHGDNGQFKRIATLALGSGDGGIIIHDPPLAFQQMPTFEEEWVREERMELKARRNNRPGKRRRGARRGRRRKVKQKSGDSHPAGIWKSKDSPEVIARKRAERKARREYAFPKVKRLESYSRSRWTIFAADLF